MRSSVIRSVALFVGLAIAAAVLVVVASALGEGFARTVLLTFGGPIFGAGLAVFLLHLTLALPAQTASR